MQYQLMFQLMIFKTIFNNFVDTNYMDIFLINKSGFTISSLTKNSDILNDFLKNNPNFDDFENAKTIHIQDKKYSSSK